MPADLDQLDHKLDQVLWNQKKILFALGVMDEMSPQTDTALATLKNETQIVDTKVPDQPMKEPSP